MKENIHPKYYPKAKVTCACGNTFEVGATVPEIDVEVCSACHPYYTGKHKLLDTQKRVDKFKAKLARGEALRQKAIVQKQTKKSKKFK
jgi:large subunit ribosomal protein L31